MNFSLKNADEDQGAKVVLLVFKSINSFNIQTFPVRLHNIKQAYEM